MDIDNLQKEEQIEFYECVLNPNTPFDCLKALFMILGLRAKVNLSSDWMLSQRIVCSP
jgi:hypothetical protein